MPAVALQWERRPRRELLLFVVDRHLTRDHFA